MDHQKNQASAPRSFADTGTRVDSLTERVKKLSAQLQVCENRILKNATALGFYTPQPDTGALTAVASSLNDAIEELERRVENVSGALNVYD